MTCRIISDRSSQVALKKGEVHYNWRCPKSWGFLSVLIHFNGIFLYKPSISRDLGYPHDWYHPSASRCLLMSERGQPSSLWTTPMWWRFFCNGGRYWAVFKRGPQNHGTLVIFNGKTTLRNFHTETDRNSREKHVNSQKNLDNLDFPIYTICQNKM